MTRREEFILMRSYGVSRIAFSLIYRDDVYIFMILARCL